MKFRVAGGSVASVLRRFQCWVTGETRNAISKCKNIYLDFCMYTHTKKIPSVLACCMLFHPHQIGAIWWDQVCSTMRPRTAWIDLGWLILDGFSTESVELLCCSQINSIILVPRHSRACCHLILVRMPAYLSSLLCQRPMATKREFGFCRSSSPTERKDGWASWLNLGPPWQHLGNVTFH